MNVTSPPDPSAVTVRAATADDAVAVADAMLASRRAFLPYAPSAHPEPDFRDWVRDVLLGSPGAFVAVSGDEVIGVIATSSSDGASWIDQFYLRPEVVGQGVGTRMLAVALENLPGPVRLWTFQQNAGSRRFYERHGFEPIRMTDGSDNEERCPDVLYGATGGKGENHTVSLVFRRCRLPVEDELWIPTAPSGCWHVPRYGSRDMIGRSHTLNRCRADG